jgi:hypothetical protein
MNPQGLAMAAVQPAPTDTNIYLLSDHLDAALAIGEDLLGQHVLLYPATPGTGEAALIRQQDELAAFVSTVYALELGITMRLLQARKRIAELRATETRFKPYFSSFVGGTAALVDAVDVLGRAADQLGRSPLSFLIARGLLPADAARLPENVELTVTDAYRIAGGIPLGDLMDMLASFLDGLELVFELYPKEAEVLHAPLVAPAFAAATVREAGGEQAA